MATTSQVFAAGTKKLWISISIITHLDGAFNRGKFKLPPIFIIALKINVKLKQSPFFDLLNTELRIISNLKVFKTFTISLL